jgi:adenylosuccinate synthase
MKTPKAVIGAGYGDEGKGLITDYLCSKHGADLVVRFNGGAQAGHTVQTPSGERLTFSQLGAGSFTGAATFLSEHFIVNPLLFFKELEMFDDYIRTIPEVFVDPRAIVTTPYDMLINQLVEDSRGSSRHGSCGVGINETVTRSLADYSNKITFGLINEEEEFIKRVKWVRDTWFPSRCFTLGIDAAKGADIINNDNIFTNFIMDAQSMASGCAIEEPDYFHGANQIVFEGAQGLLLDQDYGLRPHVTRSNTGIPNVISILNEMNIDHLDVTYVTRSYLTRHGAGPLEHELTGLPYKNVFDPTNIPNAYQGSLRYSYLDINQLAAAINHDLSSDLMGISVSSNIAITCLDQVGDSCKVYYDGMIQTLQHDDYGDIGDMIGMLIRRKSPFHDKLLKSFGPTRNDIIEKP